MRTVVAHRPPLLDEAAIPLCDTEVVFTKKGVVFLCTDPVADVRAGLPGRGPRFVSSGELETL